MADPIIIGAEKTSIQGPGTLAHEGGDTILIADVEGGLAQQERGLAFEGENIESDGDEEFMPSDAGARSAEIGEAATVRALGQANASFHKAS